MPATHLEQLTTEQLQALLDSLPVPVFVKRPDSTVMLVNKAWEASRGIALADLAGSNGEGFFPPEQIAEFLARDEEARDKQQTISYRETYWSPRHGANRLGQTTKSFLHGDDGRALFLVGTTLDMTEQQQL